MSTLKDKNMTEEPLHRFITSHADIVDVHDSIDPLAALPEVYGDNDRTISAIKDVEKAQSLVTLRRGSYLNGSEWRKSLQESHPEAYEPLLKELETKSLSPTVQTVVALLAECSKEESAYQSYINQLPASVPLPLTWTQEQQDKLRPTAAHLLMDSDLVQSLYATFASPLMSKFPSVWTEEYRTLDKFQWAYTIVSSRAFQPSGISDPTLLPLIDMANHDPDEPTAEIQATDDSSFQLVALQHVATGKPVTISYGDLSNAELLCKYGFVLSTPLPSDVVIVSSSELFATYNIVAGEEMLQAEDAPPRKKQRVKGKGKRKGKQKAKARHEDDGVVFRLHSDAEKEYGLADGIVDYITEKNWPLEALEEALTLLLRSKDKEYSEALESTAESDIDHQVQTILTHERSICRRILLGLLSLEEESSSEGEQDD